LLTLVMVPPAAPPSTYPLSLHDALPIFAMPGIDGLEVARHLQAFEPRPAVVFCTAYDAHALSAFDAEAVDYLVKPVRPERLASALQRARMLAAGRQRQPGEADGARRTHRSEEHT